MAFVDIRGDRLREAFDRIPADTPFLMLNLLRFHDEAQYPDGSRGLTGAEAYREYGIGARRHLARIGAEVVMMGATAGTIIGPDGEDWHQMLLVRYPSIAAFSDMVSDPDYADAAAHRTAAVADSRLIPVLQ